MHWTMVPSFWTVVRSFWTVVPSFMLRSPIQESCSYRRRPRDDLRNFLGDRRLPRLVVDQLQLIDDLSRVVRRSLHRDHARALLRRDVLVGGLKNDRFDVAREQSVEHRLGVRLINVIPWVLALFDLAFEVDDGKYLALDRRLLHGVFESRRDQMQFIDLPGNVGVELNLDRTDQLVEVRAVTEPDDVRDDVCLQPVHEAEALVADDADLHAHTLRLPRFDLGKREAQGVGVETSAEALVGRDDYEPDILRLAPFDHKGMAIFRVGMREMTRDREHAAHIGARSAHTLLGLFHLRGRNHFHRLGDLARVLHALDLVADFF